MINIVGFSGSLRRDSYNTALLRAAAAMMPPGSGLKQASIADIPLYNGDQEAADGIPPPVARLKDAIAEADGLLLAMPEYNSSVPGVAKNAVDWLSRPPADIARVFAGKPVAIMGAARGGFGTVLGQHAWLPVFHKLGAELWAGGRLLVSRAATVFDADGRLVDAKIHEALREFLEGFVAYAGARAKKTG